MINNSGLVSEETKWLAANSGGQPQPSCFQILNYFLIPHSSRLTKRISQSPQTLEIHSRRGPLHEPGNIG